jgi:N-hydroxyarylamine O-acetyltransferase
MFTRLRLCTLATPTGRVTLTARANGSFKWLETTPEGRRERPLKDEKEYEQLLACAFGIHLSPSPSAAEERRENKPNGNLTEPTPISPEPG